MNTEKTTSSREFGRLGRERAEEQEQQEEQEEVDAEEEDDANADADDDDDEEEQEPSGQTVLSSTFGSRLFSSSSGTTGV